MTLFLCRISGVAMSDISIFTQRLYKSVGLWYNRKGSMTPLTWEERMQFSGNRDIKGGETESKGYYGRRLVDNTGAGKVKTPWNPKGSKAFLVDFW